LRSVQARLMRAATASPIMTDVKWVFARQSSGMMEASATRRPARNIP
jgi:hypothetical protein